MRSSWACLIWVVYCIISLLYFTTFTLIEPLHSKIMYLSASFLVMCYCFAQVLIKLKGYVILFVALCLSAIATNMFFILYYHIFNVDNYQFKFGIFIGLEAVTALFIFISGNKRGLFNGQ